MTSSKLLFVSVVLVALGLAADVVLTIMKLPVPSTVVSVINAGLAVFLLRVHAGKVAEARRLAVLASDSAGFTGLLKAALKPVDEVDRDADTLPPTAMPAVEEKRP